MTIIDELMDLVDTLNFQFPDEDTKRIWASWVLHTYSFQDLDYSPRLYLTSATHQCGKSSLLTFTARLANNGKKLAMPSAASMFTLIEQEQPTLCIDEMSRFYERTKEDTAEVTGILLEGSDPDGAPVPRVTLQPKRKVELFNTYGPIAFAGTDRGNIPEDVLDRAIEIRLRRKVGMKASTLTRAQRNELLKEALEKIQAFIQDNKHKIKDFQVPSIPNELLESATDRYIDKWKPLFIINDLVDKEDVPAVPERTDSAGCTVDYPLGINGYKIRKAAVAYLKDEQQNIEEQIDHKTLIIYHFKDIFDKYGKTENGERYITPSEACSKLNQMEDAPWGEYNNGEGISAKRVTCSPISLQS